MIQGKNLKLKLGLCGLALTSFLAINAHSTVHADTVNSGNANAITWDSDQEDSQVVHEDSNQSQPTQNAQEKAPATQSVQSNVQNRAEKSAVRVSSFDTSAVNRLNANSVRNNQVKVATVHDTSQMPVQKQKVAQFNQGSKIYTLNGSNQLSKNNGDGYVITNAGTYNGRAVDIGVTINNVQNNQGTYTTKWSNGDNTDVTGKTDANFKYQDSVLLNQQQVAPQVDQSRTRTRTVTQAETIKNPGYAYHFSIGSYTGSGQYGDTRSGEDYYIAPNLLEDIKSHYGLNDKDAVMTIIPNVWGWGDDMDSMLKALSDDTKDSSQQRDVPNEYTSGGHIYFIERHHLVDDTLPDDYGYNDAASGGYIFTEKPNVDFNKVSKDAIWDQLVEQHYVNNTIFSHMTTDDYNKYGKLFKPDYTWTETKPVQVTDHLQLASSTPASLGYNYTVGLYDAQTGDLITDLKAEYKGKTGAQATASTNVMNSAIKNKIQQINQGKATVSYTGTKANDDVAFYQETRQVNPQDKNVNRQVQRVIHINFPNGKKPASYDSITDSAGNKLTLDSNNNLTQSMSFTRTGVQNIVSGQVTYGNWQQHGSINAVTLPSIPGYTMVTNN